MEKCIYRGSTKLFVPLPMVDSYHCYHPSHTSKKCLVSVKPEQQPWVEEKKYNVCDGCTNRVEKLKPPEQSITYGEEMVFVSTESLMADTLHLAGKVPHDCSGIVGIARSGLMPATALASYLHLPLFEFSPDPVRGQFQLREITSGTRGRQVHQNEGPLFVVDDTIHSGAMSKIVRTFFGNRKIIYAVVYALPDAIPLVDVYEKTLPSPHLLEWNLFNTTIISGHGIDPRTHGGFGFDFDGILCYDPPPNADRDNNDLEWLRNARPTAYLPRNAEIPLIVTMRLESWRKDSEDWLRRHGVRWKRMEMCQHENAADRDAVHLQAVIEHKVKHFKDSACSFFVESDPQQAALIYQLTDKPVLCPIERKIYQRRGRGLPQ